MSMYIYLAHPMSNADAVSLQRKDNLKVAIQIAQPDALIFDPSTYNLKDEMHGKLIIMKNKMDILRCDITIADLMKPSIGTSMEVLFALMNGKKVIVLTHSTSAWVQQSPIMVASDEREVIAHLNLNAFR